MPECEHLDRLARKLADEGNLIAAGWTIFRLNFIPLEATAAQVESMRFTWMASAQHLFTSMVAMVEPGVQEMEGDMTRMAMIHRELNGFAQELVLRAQKPAGSA